MPTLQGGTIKSQPRHTGYSSKQVAMGRPHPPHQRPWCYLTADFFYLARSLFRCLYRLWLAATRNVSRRQPFRSFPVIIRYWRPRQMTGSLWLPIHV